MFDMCNMQENNRRSYQQKIVLLSLLLSILLHAAGAWILLQLHDYRHPKVHHRQKSTKTIQIKRTPQAAENQKEGKKQQLPFAKTDSERPEQAPEQADFQGKRNSRAESQQAHPQNDDNSPTPNMNGEHKDELNTVERERQDGPIEHEGKNAPTPASPPSVPEAPPGQDAEPATTAIAESPAQTDEQAKPQPTAPKETAHKPTPQQTGSRAQDERPIYDPSLATHAQPGFRTTERRSNSTGRFILGRNPALNVSATPMGKYEELIYRLVARRWYMACDEHRGDIIPGTIIIAFRLNKRGSVETMNLITRRGASVIQQSFTFGAIRRAQLPPMPQAVQQELIGEQLELIFTFNFD